MNKKYQVLFVVLCFPVLLLAISCTPSESVKGGETHNHEEEVYTCPMHPEIRQNKPGTCPICHMKLVKVEKQSGTQDQKANIDLNISPYQAELIGIKPIKPDKKDVVYTIPVSGRILSRNSVALQVFEKDLRYINRGAKFTWHTEIYPEKEIKGEIVSIDNLADPTSRTVRIVGAIQGRTSYALMESSFNGEIQVDLGAQLIIPEQAVLFTGKGNIVYVYEKQTLHPQKVILGPKVDEHYIVREGLSEDTEISSGPNFLIDSESKIRGLNDQKHH